MGLKDYLYPSRSFRFDGFETKVIRSCRSSDVILLEFGTIFLAPHLRQGEGQFRFSGTGWGLKKKENRTLKVTF